MTQVPSSKDIPPRHTPWIEALRRGTAAGSEIADETCPPDDFETQVADRFGIFPNFFRSADAAPELIQHLWAFAKAAYLDNPMPSVFKERLFVWLSRFCPVRYCIVRHVGFLLGGPHGRAAGDGAAIPASIEEVAALLRQPSPWQRDMAPVYEHLEGVPAPIDWPPAGSDLEDAIFCCAAVMFIEPAHGERATHVISRALGRRRFEFFSGYLAFIRTAHYWTLLHSDIESEDDMQLVMRGHAELARLLLEDSEAGRCGMAADQFEELSSLRELHEHRELERAKSALEHELAAVNRMHQVSTRVVETDDVTPLLDEILEAAIDVTGADMGNIQLPTGATSLKIRSQRGFEAPFLDFFDTVHAGEGACGTAMARAERVIVEDIASSGIVGATAALDVMLAANVRAVQSTPLANRSGRVVGVLSTHYRTPQRPSERSLRLLDILARQAADLIERSNVERALRDSEAELRKRDLRKDEFLAMLAHELRNPLAPIRNALGVIRKTEGSPDPVTAASAIMERQVLQMVRLVDDLLDVSRISRGQVQLRRETIDLVESVNQAIEGARPLCDSMAQTLVVSLPETPVFVDGDPTRLIQTVGNLLNNACKFTDRGGRVSLSLAAENGEGVIRVRDSGIGIAAEQLPHIFDLFAQADTSLERSVSGLGIGLTVVRNLIELHGGSAAVSSAGLGHGSEFVIRLPLLVEPAIKVAAPSEEVPGVSALRILVVDDNRDSAESLAMLLELDGNETAIAYDGVEAIDMAATFRPDVVLCDIGLPKLNGYEVCRRIRQEPWGRDLIMIAATGLGQEGDREQATAAGFSGHLMKPFDPALLRKFLTSRESAA